METRNYENVKGIVTSVMLSKGTTDRLTFVLREDDIFRTIDFQTGEEKDTNMFGLKVFNFVNQVANNVPQIQLAHMMAMGKMVNPKIISLVMTNAEIEIKREFKAEGEAREGTNDVYEKDCIVSKFVSVKTHINPLAEPLINNLIVNQPYVETAVIPNPFGI